MYQKIVCKSNFVAENALLDEQYLNKLRESHINSRLLVIFTNNLLIVTEVCFLALFSSFEGGESSGSGKDCHRCGFGDSLGDNYVVDQAELKRIAVDVG